MPSGSTLGYLYVVIVSCDDLTHFFGAARYGECRVGGGGGWILCVGFFEADF